MISRISRERLNRIERDCRGLMQCDGYDAGYLGAKYSLEDVKRERRRRGR